MTAVPFAVNVPDAELVQLYQKLDLTRWPDELEGAGWSYGAPLADVKRLATYWRESFDWRAQETKINDALPQFTTDVDVDGFGTLNIHFVHKRSSRPDAIPLLFQHGWPGSFLEVSKLLPLLTEPTKATDPAFHVVAPSLAGYAFSQAPSKPGFGIRQYAEVAHKIMLQLGYDQYVTQGGDWGAGVTRVMGYLYAPEHCKGSHTNMMHVDKPTLTKQPFLWLLNAIIPYSKREKAALARMGEFFATGAAYSQIQGTRPQTLGYGLADSPVGLLAWIYEKLHEWTDAYPWTDDEILTWVSIYYHSRAGPAASLRIYFENQQPGGGSRGDVEKNKRYPSLPIGVSYFPREIINFPKRWAKTGGNVVYQSAHDKGGHFAAWEMPEALAWDLGKMFGRGGAAFGVVDGKDGYEKEVAKKA
ncbi:alpha/beta-hydrolase [Exidia glandulosa HHB12029]|uniref:Alpha/beta-hydrolase n=1 Tax=Exidia glandulosa HHB12029 TaxID=1314781 RepID=A0A166NGT9_EXIGL|nr:alpha/beta-hydrolase [Exidia glandulosa HHB12029]